MDSGEHLDVIRVRRVLPSGERFDEDGLVVNLATMIKDGTADFFGWSINEERLKRSVMREGRIYAPKGFETGRLVVVGAYNILLLDRIGRSYFEQAHEYLRKSGLDSNGEKYWFFGNLLIIERGTEVYVPIIPKAAALVEI